MPAPNLNSTTPAAPTGAQNIAFQSDGTPGHVSASDPVMVGDTGSGGLAGNVPAPPAGAAAAGKFLKADGTWTAPVPRVRTVSTTDTATANDHTLIFIPSAGFTETLPASPTTGQELYLVNDNTGSFAVTVSGNGHNIWTLGTSAASISLAANTTAILQFDATLWRQIK